MNSKKKSLVIKILIILIIICSILSGFVGAYIMTKYNIEKGEIKNFTEKVIKNEKKINIVDLENKIISLVEKSSKSVVSIVAKKDLIIYRSDPRGFFYTPSNIIEKKIGGGTGFFITKDGKIITNKHVIKDKNAQYTIITYENKEYDSKVLSVSKNNDIAVLQILSEKNTFIPLKFIKKIKDIKVGQFAISIGNALSEFQNSVSFGVVSGKDRNIKDGDNILSGLIQSDNAINPGNSGGPLINLNGEVMGINTAIINGAPGIGFSISITEEKLNYILSSIEKSGEIKTPFIGINYISISSSIKKEFDLKSDYGLYIIDQELSIKKGSPADKTGIRPGDILLEANGKKLLTSKDLKVLIKNKIPGNIIKLKVLKKDLIIKDYELILGEK